MTSLNLHHLSHPRVCQFSPWKWISLEPLGHPTSLLITHQNTLEMKELKTNCTFPTTSLVVPMVQVCCLGSLLAQETNSLHEISSIIIHSSTILQEIPCDIRLSPSIYFINSSKSQTSHATNRMHLQCIVISAP
jgi:hypothetical protein